jgi:PPK2 family polyphosphate:nucleotide phosphotransferase
MNYKRFSVSSGKKVRLKDYDPGDIGKFKNKVEAEKKLRNDIAKLARYQEVLYAHNRYALLIIFQAMDAAGKDSAIKHVMSGVNPQGCQVFSFKAPSNEELDHDYLWRCSKALPERGRIGIFNRSYYEDVLVTRVHPDVLERQKLPRKPKGKELWKSRFEEINNFERYLVDNGIVVLKFFLNLSKEEQKQRFLDRINKPEKNWKFTAADVEERTYWDEYLKAYEDVFTHTSTRWAPWYIIPADHKWFSRVVVADIIVGKLKKLNLKYPTVGQEQKRNLREAKQKLEDE